MRATSPRTASPGRLAWLLWLALLLPLAQAASVAHGAVHAATPGGVGDGKQAPQDAGCGLCLVAAAVGGGVPAGAPPSLPRATVRHAPPSGSPGVRPGMAAGPVYRSRAPPLRAG